MADEALREFERAVARGDRTEHELKLFRLKRGCCPFCGSNDGVEPWGDVETTFTVDGMPIDRLPRVTAPSFICVACAGPSRLAMHWSTFEIEGQILFSQLAVVALMKPGRAGVRSQLGRDVCPMCQQPPSANCDCMGP